MPLPIAAGAGVLASWLTTSILWSARFFFESVFFKLMLAAVFFFAISFVSGLLANLLTDYLKLDSLSTMFGGLDSGIKYFLGLASLDTGFPMVLTAFATKFMIRRLPFIG
jgi:Protein of unknown function (DUF2523)